ncbi:MAG TPA: hypothetical protein HA319_06910 [Nitrosopumilaceae archaeon]|nr:hypothetical protein [Nitrosopumilaceae archaeon]
MTTKIILAASMVAVFAVSMFGAAFASGHLAVVDSSVSKQGVYTTTVTVSADIPTDTDENFGYAWFTDKGVLVATSHPVAVDSVGQKEAGDFHTHLVQLEATGDCTSGLAVGSLTKHQIGRVSVDGSVLTINNIPPGQTGVISEGALAFTLSLENDRVCVNPVV